MAGLIFLYLKGWGDFLDTIVVYNQFVGQNLSTNYFKTFYRKSLPWGTNPRLQLFFNPSVGGSLWCQEEQTMLGPLKILLRTATAHQWQLHTSTLWFDLQYSNPSDATLSYRFHGLGYKRRWMEMRSLATSNDEERQEMRKKLEH